MSILVREITEYWSEVGDRLGRHVEHDDRSFEYAFDAAQVDTIASVAHNRTIPILDQSHLLSQNLSDASHGNDSLGSCTGNAGTGALGSGRLAQALPPGLVPMLDERYAIGLYADATALDRIPGGFPPSDTGSTGLAVAKALKARGLIAGYQHTFSVTDALKALQVAPLLIGIDWYDSFDRVGADGILTISQGSGIRGGHELVIRELAVYGSSLAGSDVLTGDNSWGPTWGDRGRFRMTVDTFDALLHHEGDVTVLVPATSPAPTPQPTPDPPAPSPTPTPTPDELDRQMWTLMQGWAKARGLS